MSKAKKLINLAIQSSPNGEDQWDLVRPIDLPAWVTEDDSISQLASGNMVCGDPDGGSKWYRGIDMAKVI